MRVFNFSLGALVTAIVALMRMVDCFGGLMYVQGHDSTWHSCRDVCDVQSRRGDSSLGTIKHVQL